MTPTLETRLGRLARGLAAALALAAVAAHAADFPERPVKLVVPYAPGGSTDVLARALAVQMGKDLGQSLVVENKPGANTKVGAASVAHGPTDGYTLLVASSASMVLNPLLYRKINYAPQTDFRLLAIVAEAPLVVVTNSQVPAHNLKEFAAYARAHPGRVNYGSVGLGNPLQLATLMLNEALQVDATHVPYNGSAPALTALMSNDVQWMTDVAGSSLPYIRSGRLQALAVTGAERLKSLPEVPTVAESAIPGFRAATWFGVALPAAAPQAAAARVQAAVRKAMADPQFRATVEQQSLLPQPPRTDAELKDYTDRDRATWGKVIREHNIVLED